MGVDLFLRVHINAASTTEERDVDAAVARAGLLDRTTMTASIENTGFSAAHNRCLAALFSAGCTAAVVHNPDLVLEPDAIAALHAAAELWPEQIHGVLCGPVLQLADPRTLRPTGLTDTTGIRWTPTGRHLDANHGAPIPPLPPSPFRVPGVSGACLYVQRNAYDQVITASEEFFDVDFFAYREDAELCLRAALLGIPSIVVPAARGLHVRRLRGTTRGADILIDRLGVRNRFLLAFKYGRHRPGVLPLVLLRDAIVLLGVLLKERSSLPGLMEAWKLRHAMRAKRARLAAADTDKSRFRWC